MRYGNGSLLDVALALSLVQLTELKNAHWSLWPEMRSILFMQTSSPLRLFLALSYHMHANSFLHIVHAQKVQQTLNTVAAAFVLLSVLLPSSLICLLHSPLSPISPDTHHAHRESRSCHKSSHKLHELLVPRALLHFLSIYVVITLDHLVRFET